MQAWILAALCHASKAASTESGFQENGSGNTLLRPFIFWNRVHSEFGMGLLELPLCVHTLPKTILIF